MKKDRNTSTGKGATNENNGKIEKESKEEKANSVYHKKIQRDFHWGGGSLERKLHLINWNTICGSKESGG